MRSFILSSIILLGVAANAYPQSLNNPSTVRWEHDDFARTSTYELGYYLVGATEPVQTVVIPKVNVSPSGVSYETLLPRPVFGTFVSKLRACAIDVSNATVCSDWSNTTANYILSPLVPANLVVRP
jgi:hypothetical protein